MCFLSIFSAIYERDKTIEKLEKEKEARDKKIQELEALKEVCGLQLINLRMVLE